MKTLALPEQIVYQDPGKLDKRESQGKCRGERQGRGRRDDAAFSRPLPTARGAQLTADFSALPAVKRTTRRFGILIAAPVCGLRAVRAFRCAVLNVPKPTNVIGCPFLSDLVTPCDERVDGGCRVGLGEAGVLGDLRDEFLFVHERLR